MWFLDISGHSGCIFVETPGQSLHWICGNYGRAPTRGPGTRDILQTNMELITKPGPKKQHMSVLKYGLRLKTA